MLFYVNIKTMNFFCFLPALLMTRQIKKSRLSGIFCIPIYCARWLILMIASLDFTVPPSFLSPLT